MTFASRKGQTLLLLFVVFLGLFIFGFVSLFVHDVVNDINDDIQADTDAGTQTKEISQNVTSGIPYWLDGGFAFLLVLLWVVLLVTAWNFDTHAVLFLVVLIILGFLIFVAASLAEAYGDFIADDDYTTFSANFPITDFFMSNMVMFIIGMGASVLIVLYSNRG